MASSSGTTSSGSSLLQNSGSEEGLQQLMDQRKKKRMMSNRDSARRSRMKKQKHLDDLMAQVAQLRKENNQIVASISVTTQHYFNYEAENSILRVQVEELSHRLQALNEIISVSKLGFGFATEEDRPTPYNYANANAIDSVDGLMMNNISPWNWSYLNVNQPIMAAADNMFQY